MAVWEHPDLSETALNVLVTGVSLPLSPGAPAGAMYLRTLKVCPDTN